MDALNFGSNERIDYADLRFGVVDTPMGFHSAMGANLLAAQSGQRVSILSGFAASSPSANVVQVSLGRALGAYRKGANVLYGVVVAQGDAVKTLDVTALTAGTYGVFIRFNYVEGTQANRVFWAAGGSGYEYAQAQNTRLLANWDLSVDVAAAGPEWIQVATVALPAMTFTDVRPLYFEGRPDQGYASTWGGGANDRSSNRAAYGVTDWQTAWAAVRTCLEDLKGPGLRRWYDPVIGGQNIGFAGTPAASRTAWGDANFYAQGSTTLPGVTFDTGDSVAYDRANNRWSFAVAGSPTALLGTGLALGSYASAGTAAPAGGLLASGQVGIGTSTLGSNALTVAGGTTSLSALAVTGASALTTLSVSGASTLSGLLSVGANVALTGSGRTLVVGGSTPTTFTGPGAGGVSCIETFGAALGTTAASAQIHQSWQMPDGNTSLLQLFGYRNSAGSSFATADSYLMRRVDSSFYGFLGFYSSGGVAGQNGIGLGVGAAGTVPNLLAYASNTVLNTPLLPGTSNSYNLGSSSALWGSIFAGGVVQGSRILAIRGWVPASSLTTNGTYPAQNYLPGSAPGFTQVTFTPDTAGSIAGYSMKVYNATGTAGTLSLSTNGASTNPNSGAQTYTAVNANYSAKFAPGTYPFSAGQQIVVQVTSAGWAQASGNTGVELTLYAYQ